MLQGLPGVEEVNGNANSGGSQVFLTFAIGTDMKSALVDVIGRMSRLPPLPRDSDRPFVQLGGDGGDSNQQLSFFFVQLLPGTEGPIERYRRFVEDVVKPRIESVPGVAQVEVQGGPPDDVRITLDLARAAALGIGIPDIARQAASATNVSAGQLDVGRRQYSLRYTGRYDAQDLGQLVLAWRDGQPVRLADLATVEMRPPDRTLLLLPERQPGDRPAHRARAGRERARHARGSEAGRRGAARRAAASSAAWASSSRSMHRCSSSARSICWSRTSWSAHCSRSRACGGSCATRARPCVIASTIPICLLATFCALDLAGRSINVISLAGLAFAVGMVVEGAIVVSGNIIRLKEGGMPIEQAAHDGTRQVVPALFASTATTIAVFLPVLFLKDVEGQIFADLALTISIAVAFSIVVAITVVPAAAGRWLGAHSKNSGYGAGWPWLTDRVIAWTRTRKQQLGWVGALLVAPLAAVVAAAAEARLSAAGQARRDRCVLQLPARHEPGGRQSRDRAEAASSAWSPT